jgi:hypothetical protein
VWIPAIITLLVMTCTFAATLVYSLLIGATRDLMVLALMALSAFFCAGTALNLVQEKASKDEEALHK